MNGSQNRARALTLSGNVWLMTTRPSAVSSRSRHGSQMSPAVQPPLPWMRMTLGSVAIAPSPTLSTSSARPSSIRCRCAPARWRGIAGDRASRPSQTMLGGNVAIFLGVPARNVAPVSRPRATACADRDRETGSAGRPSSTTPATRRRCETCTLRPGLAGTAARTARSGRCRRTRRRASGRRATPARRCRGRDRARTASACRRRPPAAARCSAPYPGSSCVTTIQLAVGRPATRALEQHIRAVERLLGRGVVHVLHEDVLEPVAIGGEHHALAVRRPDGRVVPAAAGRERRGAAARQIHEPQRRLRRRRGPDEDRAGAVGRDAERSRSGPPAGRACPSLRPLRVVPGGDRVRSTATRSTRANPFARSTPAAGGERRRRIQDHRRLVLERDRLAGDLPRVRRRTAAPSARPGARRAASPVGVDGRALQRSRPTSRESSVSEPA